MVPHIRLAPAAASKPRRAWGEPWPLSPPRKVEKPSMMAAMTMQTPPNTTLALLIPLAPRNSRNSRQPHNRPIRELAFHRGKATASPTSRMAKTVRVLATAHSAPASSAQTIRCGLAATSAKTKPVPFIRVGKVQRAVKTPATMQSEMAKGEKPASTSLVGASAAPSQTPAARPHSTPRPCSEAAEPRSAAMDHHQQEHAAGQHQRRNPELNVCDDRSHPFS